jgi:ankyrin repeat protein
VRERGCFRGLALLHYAAQFRSVDFIKVLVEADRGRECVKAIDLDGWLPIHSSCFYGNFEVAKYLLLLYPESINVITGSGSSLLHLVVLGVGLGRNGSNDEDGEELTRFLILHDQGALAMPDYHGGLPLHSACIRHRLSLAKLLYDAYPNATTVQNNDGFTPLDVARRRNWTEILAFLQSQLELQHQARDIVQPDANDQLPIHRVLQSFEPSLGTIKLMVPANPESLAAADSRGFIPLRIACKFGHLDIVTYLIEAKED